MRMIETAWCLPMSRDVPRPLDVELPRERVVRMLERRWDHAITVVVAGAGFGKTTALAQAFRASTLDPRGVEAWVSCDPGHEDAARLAGALLDALPDGTSATAAGVRDVVAAFAALAPTEVCVTLDDVHEIPAGSPGARLLHDLVGALPATAHLVLAGRDLPDLRCARREAAGAVLRLGADELSFTDTEVIALGRRLNCRRTGRVTRSSTPDAEHAAPAAGVTRASTYNGWPALVRLAFAAGPSAPLRFVREEVLGSICEAGRRALAVLAMLGTATSEEVRTVLHEAGHDPPDPTVPSLPLVSALGDGRYRAHDLWMDAVARVVPAAELRTLRRRALALLADRGDLYRAGALAGASGEWTALEGLAAKLVRETLTALPCVTAERWLATVPPALADRPAFTLLHAAVLHARDYTDSRVDALLDDAWHGALAADAAEREDIASAALGQAVVVAHSRADHLRLATLASRADRLGSSSSPVIQLLRHSVAGVLAELAGDPEAAITEFAAAPIRGVPRPLAVPVVRFHVHCLTMAGRHAEAAALADGMLGGADDPHTSLSGALARWFGGDPADLERLRSVAHPDTTARLESDANDTVREAFVTRAQAAVISGSVGTAGDWPAYPVGDPADHVNSRDAVLAGAAAATIAIARRDESAARRIYAELLMRWPPTSPVTERHLRRFLTLGYLLDDRLRARWENADLGPAHEAARAAGRALVRARGGDLDAARALAPEHALCFLPLCWSVEVAARLGDGAGLALGQWLSDRLGAAVHDQFHTIRLAHPGAARFLTELPALPTARLGLAVLGPLQVTRDGVPVEAPELRRLRVRQLLSALVLVPRLDREQATRLLWPDHTAAGAAANLRVTLTHLRRLLEPERPGGSAMFHLRTDGAVLRLRRSEWLSVDVWDAETLAEEAGRARRAGDTDLAMDLLGRSLQLWRGEPFAELAEIPGLDAAAEIARSRDRHVRSLLSLGALQLVSGNDGEAHRLAGRALALEPFDAAGHRLLLAAAIRTGDPARIAGGRRLVTAALDELATAPDQPTAALLRRSVRR